MGSKGGGVESKRGGGVGGGGRGLNVRFFGAFRLTCF